jgi:hypothetical protein
MEDGLFPGHPRSGDWETLKGSMLAPHLQPVMESSNTGDPRFNGRVSTGRNWDSFIKPSEGLTRGGGTMAK